MRFFSVFLILSLLLCGCAVKTPPETTPPATAETVPPVTETVPPATEETLPPNPVEVLLAEMSAEEKVGQLFLARCPESGVWEDIAACHLGGLLLFGRDFENQTVQSLTQTLAAYQASADIPLLIATDEEGGSVCRVSAHPAFREKKFSSPRTLFGKGGMEAVLSAESEKAELLRALGINVNMAPVCDIATDSDAFMYRRSLGQEPETVGVFAAETVNILRENQVGSVLKHFPGYGNNADTHTGFAVDERTADALESRDLIPFSMGIEAGCGAILVSHTIVTAFDDALPASLSPAVHTYLRQEMGFDGVIVTDDLVMDAITDSYGAGESAVLAVLAGNDLLCSTQYREQYAAVLAAVSDGRISMDALNAAVSHILRWKVDLGLLT